MNTSQFTPLDSGYKLIQNQIDSFQEKGWIFLPGLCPKKELKAYADLIRETASAHNKESRPLEQRDTYGKAFLQTMNLWRLDQNIAQFTLSKRFGQVAAKLLGVEKVRLYHDQALFKEAGGGPTPWHQDGYYWPIDQTQTVTMWMPLVDIPAQIGTMSFASGSQLKGLVSKELAISDKSEIAFEAYVKGHGFTVETAGEMKAGGATFHSGLTLHKAPGNPTEKSRDVMTIIYYADGLKTRRPQNSHQADDLATWFPGIGADELARSEINPLVG